MSDGKKEIIGFKVTKKVKDLISKFANSSGKSVSDVVRESTLKEIRDTREFSFKNQLDAELNRLQTKAEKEAEAEVLGNDYIGPEVYERKIQEEQSKLEKLKNKLTMADRATMEAIRDQVAGEGDLDNVEDLTWDLERKINKSETTINKLKELKQESERLQEQVEEKAEEIFKALIKKELLTPLCEEAEQVMSRLIDDLNLLDSLIQKSSGMYRRRSIGWRIQARLEKAVPGLFDYSFTMHPKKLDASIPEIFGVD